MKNKLIIFLLSAFLISCKKENTVANLDLSNTIYKARFEINPQTKLQEYIHLEFISTSSVNLYTTLDGLLPSTPIKLKYAVDNPTLENPNLHIYGIADRDCAYIKTGQNIDWKTTITRQKNTIKSTFVLDGYNYFSQ